MAAAPAGEILSAIGFVGLSLLAGFGLGWLLVHACFSAGSAAPWRLRIVLAAGMGLGILELVWFYWLWAGGRLNRVAVVLPALAGWAGVLLWKDARGALRPCLTPPLSRLEGVLCAFLCTAVIFASVIALSKPLDTWDAVMTWGYRAQVIFEEQTLYSEAFLPPHGDFVRIQPRPRHAFGWSVLQAGLSRMWGTFDERNLRAVTFVFFILLLGVLYAALRLDHSRTRALLACTLFTTVPFLYYESIFRVLLTGGNKSNLLGGNADLPLAFFFLTGVASLFRWMKEGSPAWLALSALGMTFGSYLKNEGLALQLAMGVVVAVFAVGRFQKQAFRPIAHYALLSLVLLGPWLYFRQQLPMEPAQERLLFDVPHFRMWMEQAPLAISFFFREAAHVARWGLLWLLVLSSLVVYRHRLRQPELKSLALLLLLGLGAYAAVLAAAPVNDIEQAFFDNRTVGRFLIHFAPAAVFFMANLIWEEDRVSARSGT